ncbi:MAG: hypothetical protein ACR2K9_04550 [Solirubrobacteraceae bacterium]
MLKKMGKVGTSLAVLGAIAVGSAAIAGAATGKKSSTPAPPPPHHGYGYGPPGPPPPGMPPGGPRDAHDFPGHGPGTPLTGDTAQKVKAAALAKVKGGTVMRLEADGPQGSEYEAHVRKADGTPVLVLVDKQFEVTAVRTFRGPPGGPRGGGPGFPGHRAETPLTGETAQKVKDAALAKVKGGTIQRVETDGDENAPYEAHVRKSDGSEVVVRVNK